MKASFPQHPQQLAIWQGLRLLGVCTSLPLPHFAKSTSGWEDLANYFPRTRTVFGHLDLLDLEPARLTHVSGLFQGGKLVRLPDGTHDVQ